MELELKIAELAADIKTHSARMADEIKALGEARVETKTALENLQRQFDAMDARQQRIQTASEQKSLVQELKENESFLKLQKDGRGTAILQIKGGLAALERKTTITSSAVGSATSGVLNPERMAGVEMLPRVALTVRNFLPSAPTTSNAIDYVKESAFTNAASPQTEASDKAESALTFTTGTAAVRTLAHWIPATKQILDDFDGLAVHINNTLIYGLKLKEEQEILSGDNTGVHLNGLITQATAFTTALLGSGVWHKADVIARAIQQLETANQIPAQWVVLNPVDYTDIMLAKDTAYQYIGMNAYSPFPMSLWTLPLHKTNNISSGTFLVGNSMKAIIRDRETVNIEVSTEHSDYFIKNMVAIRCEERLTLVVVRPASFITGSFSKSPA